MNEFLRKRVDRKLESLPDERIYQVLDYIEFLESKYASQPPAEPSALQKLAETVEDTLRAGKVGASAIKTTMDAMSAAGRVMSGLAAAGKSVVDQVSSARDPNRIDANPASSETQPPAGPPAPDARPESA